MRTAFALNRADLAEGSSSGGSGGAIDLSGSGEIDATNAAQFEEAVRELAAGVTARLDMSAVVYCDSAGFGALDRLIGDGTVRLVIAPSSPIRAGASLLGLAFEDAPDHS